MFKMLEMMQKKILFSKQCLQCFQVETVQNLKKWSEFRTSKFEATFFENSESENVQTENFTNLNFTLFNNQKMLVNRQKNFVQ